MEVWILIVIGAALITTIAIATWTLRLRVSTRVLRDPEEFEHIITIDDFEIFYQDVGTGPALLFLHGIGASTFTWRHQLSEFSKTHRLVIPDLPGFGRSSKLTNKKYDLESQRDRMLEFIDKLKLQEVVVVGSSMGGLIAISIAQARPRMVKKLVLLAPATEPSLVPKGLYQASWTVHLIQPAITKRTIEMIMRSVNANPEAINEKTIAKYYEPYQDKRAMQTFVKATQTIRFKKTKALLKSVETPTLILYGAKDKRVPRWVIDRLTK
ncbi:MAG: alpha/beta hydrolase, partial [Pseudomonadota bacterium]